MVVITRLADKGMLWILLALVLLLHPKTRKLGLEMLVTIMIEVFICNILLKPIIARPRPFTLNNGIELLISPPTDYSFPSGHAAVSFAGATTLLIHRSPFKWFALILTVCISFSRLYLCMYTIPAMCLQAHCLAPSHQWLLLSLWKNGVSLYNDKADSILI